LPKRAGDYPPQKTLYNWALAACANAHFDFSPGDAEPDIVELACEVLPDAPEGAPDEGEE
jgi:hypothetical protein